MLILSLKAKGNPVLIMTKGKNTDPQLKVFTIGWRYLQGETGQSPFLYFLFFIIIIHFSFN